MLFRNFALALGEIEKTSSRLVMTDLIVKLLKELDAKEIDKGIYLMLGEMAPKWRGVEFMMAEKMVLRAMGEGALGEYKKRGDLGEVVEVLVKQEKSSSLGEVYDRLMDLARDSGEGSQERKVQKLVELFSEKGNKYIARIVLGKLRLGFSDKTILDALSVARVGDKSMRKEFDRIYQIYPDVGRIAKGIENIRIEVGVPIEPALCQRLNSSEEIIEKMGEVAVERKYDGTRVQIHFERGSKPRTFTRNLDESSEMFPELFEMGKWVKADKLILDCEAVGVDTKTGKMLVFQETIKRKRIHGVADMAAKIPLKFFVFDVLCLDGVDLLCKPYFERRQILSRVIEKNEVLLVDEYKKTSDAVELHKYHETYLKEGFEGAVIKKWDGDYLPGRQGWNWVKIKESEGTTGKLADTLDLVVMGYYRGRGKRAGFGLGAFLAGVRKGEDILTVTKVGTGLTDEQFREINKRLEGLVTRVKPKRYVVAKNLVPDVWVDPKLVVEIAADELTKSPAHSAGFALRFPRLVRFRDDKDLDGVTEVAELERIRR